VTLTSGPGVLAGPVTRGGRVDQYDRPAQRFGACAPTARVVADQATIGTRRALGHAIERERAARAERGGAIRIAGSRRLPRSLAGRYRVASLDRIRPVLAFESLRRTGDLGRRLADRTRRSAAAVGAAGAPAAATAAAARAAAAATPAAPPAAAAAAPAAPRAAATAATAAAPASTAARATATAAVPAIRADVGAERGSAARERHRGQRHHERQPPRRPAHANGQERSACQCVHREDLRIRRRRAIRHGSQTCAIRDVPIVLAARSLPRAGAQYWAATRARIPDKELAVEIGDITVPTPLPPREQPASS